MASNKKIKNPDLQEVLEYQHSDVIYRFQKVYGMSETECQDIFEQVKKFLWLGHQRRLEKLTVGVSIDHPIVVIDEMWHNFVLFTKEYTQFCNDYFGYYIHHAPATKLEEAEYRKEIEQFETRAQRLEFKKDSKRPQYEYIYDKLGKDTFLKWYHEYPRKYSVRQLLDMQVKALEDMVLIEPPKDKAVEEAAA